MIVVLKLRSIRKMIFEISDFYFSGCEDCQTSQEGDCQKHGPLKKVADTEVSTRARRSIPHILQLKEEASCTGMKIFFCVLSLVYKLSHKSLINDSHITIVFCLG